MNPSSSGDDRPGLTPQRLAKIQANDSYDQRNYVGCLTSYQVERHELLGEVDRLQSEVTQARQALQHLTEERDEARGREWETLKRHRDNALAEVKRLGFEKYDLIYAYTDVAHPRFDDQTSYAAICEALTQEGVAAWPGDGTGIVRNMIEAQAKRAERAEAELLALRTQLTALRDKFITYRDAPMRNGNTVETSTIRKTLNVVVDELEGVLRTQEK